MKEIAFDAPFIGKLDTTIGVTVTVAETFCNKKGTALLSARQHKYLLYKQDFFDSIPNLSHSLRGRLNSAHPLDFICTAERYYKTSGPHIGNIDAWLGTAHANVVHSHLREPGGPAWVRTDFHDYDFPSKVPDDWLEDDEDPTSQSASGTWYRTGKTRQ